MSTPVNTPHFFLYEDIVRRALREDLGEAGDITTDSIVSSSTRAKGLIFSRSPGRVAGIEVAVSIFRLLDSRVETQIQCNDGTDVNPNDVLAQFQGEARALLSSERTALNILGRLCGVATATNKIVQAIQGTSTKVVCTRKTTPALRVLEKYAVRVGGGFNHRFGLDDAVLIKDNHLNLVGGVKPAVLSVRKKIGHTVKIEVEVETLDQLEQAIELKVDAVLLDNMDRAKVVEAVQMVNGRLVVEVSGGIQPENALELAVSGVDLLSVGWLTHSASAMDLSFEVQSV